ncbi:MAG: YjbQ family protein [Chloroflexi bacterium]|nr:MAG: YjbQ family protein [Chloroflexota bacterium]
MFEILSFRTTASQELVNLDEQIRAVVAASGVAEGVCHIYCPHSTAGLTINSALDSKTSQDILFEMNRLVPTRVDFFHTFDTPTDAAAHIKSTLTGVCVSCLIHAGRLMLGHSQSILFAEYDGPRNRQVYVKVVEG